MPNSTFECQLIGATKADVQATGLFGTGEAFFWRLRACTRVSITDLRCSGCRLGGYGRSDVTAISLGCIAGSTKHAGFDLQSDRQPRGGALSGQECLGGN